MLNIVMREDADKWISMRACLHQLEKAAESCDALRTAIKAAVKDTNAELPNGEKLDLPSRFDSDMHILDEICRKVENTLENTAGKPGEYAGAKNSRFLDTTRSVFNMVKADVPAIHDNLVVMVEHELPAEAKRVFEAQDVIGYAEDAADTASALPQDLTTLMEYYSARRADKLQEVYENPTFSKVMTAFDAPTRLEDIRDDAVHAIASELSRNFGEAEAVELAKSEGRLDAALDNIIAAVAEDVKNEGRDAMAAEVRPRLVEGAGDNDEFTKKVFAEAAAKLVSDTRSGVVKQVSDTIIQHFADLEFDDVISANDVKAIMAEVA